ncbi:MAG: tripartite tricarboxylate transporter substrate-binding protein, partial [Afipia sp.]|nr:tripartite tricarboxylate transporter substrate-binding protein [Afipia sp.]
MNFVWNKSLRWIVVLAGLSLAASAHAETWPSRIIKAYIPFGAGSATDVVPRLFFDRLAVELGQAIVVENRVGAGGTVGTAAVARAEPDGYSILAHSSAITIAPAIFPDLTFDATKDLSSALMIGYSANVMITSPNKPWKTVQDFIAAAKAKDATINFGSVGIGSAVHISAEKFKLAAGIEATHVPY